MSKIVLIATLTASVVLIFYVVFQALIGINSNDFGKPAINDILLDEYFISNNWHISISDLSGGFYVKKAKGRRKYDRDTIIINAERSSKTLVVEKISDTDSAFAEVYLNDKRSFVDSSYVKSLSAYPEVLTNTVECPPEFKPNKYEINKDDENILAYDFVTNNRLTFGVCSDDLATYRGLSISIYCSAREEIYNVELSAPIKEFEIIPEEIIRRIGCK